MKALAVAGGALALYVAVGAVTYAVAKSKGLSPHAAILVGWPGAVRQVFFAPGAPPPAQVAAVAPVAFDAQTGAKVVQLRPTATQAAWARG